ncbi:MAG: carbonic anhydrase [Methylotenera sp.]|nr:carbonic anhydrase [Methylotenera sp.]
MYKHPLLDRDKITPREALDVLVEGNERFTKNLSLHRDLLSIVNITKDKQHPFAAILGCSDSRTASEIIFDQGLGDIFSVRLAGNIASPFAIGSLEFSCKYLGSKLIVVLGHSRCGAVMAACDHYTGGHIGEILKHIEPAVEREQSKDMEKNSSDIEFVSRVCQSNVELQIQAILDGSEMLTKMLETKQIGIAAAVYDVSSGLVTFDYSKSLF